MLDRDSVVVPYTDGFIERRDSDLDAGTARLQAPLANLAYSDLRDGETYPKLMRANLGALERELVCDG